MMYLSHGMQITSEADTYRSIPVKKPDFDMFLITLKQFFDYTIDVITLVYRKNQRGLAKYIFSLFAVYTESFADALYVEGADNIRKKLREYIIRFYPDLKYMLL